MGVNNWGMFKNVDNESLSETRLSRINESEVDHVDLEFAARAGSGPQGREGSQYRL